MLSGAVVVLLSFLFSSRESFLLFLLCFVVFELGLEIFRLHNHKLNLGITRLFAPLMREGENLRLSGVPYYGFGCFIAYSFFPKPIAMMAVLYLAVGDPMASIFGRFAKRQGQLNTVFFQKFSTKSLEGSFACFGACTLLTYLLWPFSFDGSTSNLWIKLFVSVLGGLSATIGEIIPLRTDDNLSMPLISGALLWLMASLLGIVPGLIN